VGALSEFIFMLTRDDRTIGDAREVYARIAHSGVTHVGCKDLGLPRHELQALMDEIRANGHTSYLEVVSETADATLASARVAAEVRPDCLIGGTLIEPVQEIIAGSGIRFFPYVGKVVGHPCLLRGTIEDVARDARRAEDLGVDAVSVPVIAAGSVDSVERIRALSDRGVWAFTIGTAALDGRLVPGAPLEEQLRRALDAVSGVRS
jgi:4-hydroxythreonine-4-phosphate dehydrogenase